jgi:hypothetical protein
VPTLPRTKSARVTAIVLVALASAIWLAVAWPFGGDDESGTGRSLSGNPAAPRPPKPPPGAPSIANRKVRDFDPLAYKPDDEATLLRHARDGLAHVLYVKSPGGAIATADRVARYRPLVDRAAKRHGVNPRTLQALIFLESAGRPGVAAGSDPGSAVGLAQFLPGTAQTFGLHVDLARLRQIDRKIARNQRIAARSHKARKRRIARQRVTRLVRERPRADERLDPAKSVDGAARYLVFAENKLGRPDLAAAAYHMGVGNLQDVIADYVRPRPLTGSTPKTVERYHITYARLYFDSTPTRNAAAYRKLLSLGDDSRHYLFKLDAADTIMRLRAARSGLLQRIAELQTAKASSENLLRPEDRFPPYDDAGDLRRAYAKDELIALPDEPRRLGFRADRGMGSLARRIHERKALFRGLRPEALATLLYITKETRKIAGGSHLRVNSTVRDRKYQQALIGVNGQATREFSLHTTGFAVDVSRNFRNSREERAFVSVLERLRAHNVLDFVYEPAAIHFTVGPEGKQMLPLLDRLIGKR